MATTSRTVTARKLQHCGDYLCCAEIQPGEDYARHVSFPGDEANGGRVPFVLILCRDCQTQYDQPMPPRRSKRSGVSQEGGN